MSVPGKSAATVANLRETVAAHLKPNNEHFAIMKLDAQDIQVLEDPSKELRKDHRLSSGDLIVMEERESPTAELRALQWFRQQFTSITVLFNHPQNPQQFDFVVQTSSDQTLGDLLAIIAR